jgi:hypothetical protein
MDISERQRWRLESMIGSAKGDMRDHAVCQISALLVDKETEA